jgi:hypothetical protein
MYQLLKPLLFSIGIGPSAARHPAHLRPPGGAGANQARFAGDICLIDCGRETIRVGKALARFAPGALMRRCEQDVVNVENGRRQMWEWSELGTTSSRMVMMMLEVQVFARANENS